MKKTKFTKKKLNNILEQMNININHIENIKETNNINVDIADLNNLNVDIAESNNLNVDIAESNNLNVDIEESNNINIDIGESNINLSSSNQELNNNNKLIILNINETNNENININVNIDEVIKEHFVDDNDYNKLINKDNDVLDTKDVKETIFDDTIKETILDDTIKETILDDTAKETILDNNVKETILDDNVKETILDDNVKEIILDDNVKETILDDNVKETILDDNVKKIEEILEDNIKKNKINTLCFSGGGIKGFSFVGALEKLIEANIINLDEITLFVGTSAGAMLAFLLNLGWTIKELKDFVLNFNFSKLTGEIDSINFFEKFGIQDGERIKLLFIKFLKSKLNKKDITFKELFELTNKKLIIVGTNLTKGCEATFSVDHTPDFSVIIALKISCSIPIIFTPVKINDEFFVDGGLVNNFPINYCSKKSTIGFYVKNSHNNVIDSVKTLITSTLSLTADTISEKNIKKYLKNVVQIKNTQFNITNFDINLEYKLKIIQLGYNAAELFLSN